jgi:hypothetical protein
VFFALVRLCGEYLSIPSLMQIERMVPYHHTRTHKALPQNTMSTPTSDNDEAAIECFDWQSDDMKQVSDWKIIVNSGEAEYHVHRAFFLSAGPRPSGYFAKTFQQNLAENENNTTHLDLPDKEKELLPVLLNFVYNGTLPKLETWKYAVLFSMADYFDISSLKQNLAKTLRDKETTFTTKELIVFFEEASQNSACQELYDLLVKGLIYNFTKLEKNSGDLMKPVWLNDILICCNKLNQCKHVALRLVPRCFFKNKANLDRNQLETVIGHMMKYLNVDTVRLSSDNACRMLAVLQHFHHEDESFDSEELYGEFKKDIHAEYTIPVDLVTKEYTHLRDGQDRDLPSYEAEDLEEYADDVPSTWEDDLPSLVSTLRGICIKILANEKESLYDNSDLKDLVAELDRDSLLSILFTPPDKPQKRIEAVP